MRQRVTTVRLIIMLLLAVVAGVITGLLGWWQFAPIAGWAVAALAYSTIVWFTIAGYDAEKTAEHASREEPARAVADILILLLSLASLFAVGYVLVQAGASHGVEKGVLAGLALLSVALSWILLHTLYTLRYARLYYMGDKGVNFNQEEPPRYSDFAYLAFTLGMTFQVSDTNITNHTIRATALRHSLLSFVFGSVILASTINLIAGLSS
jgi:uncharacterized membrane protein